MTKDLSPEEKEALMEKMHNDLAQDDVTEEVPLKTRMRKAATEANRAVMISMTYISTSYLRNISLG